MKTAEDIEAEIQDFLYDKGIYGSSQVDLATFIRDAQREAWDEGQKAKCPACEGHGSLSGFRDEPGTFGMKRVAYSVTCEACNGAGFLPFPGTHGGNPAEAPATPVRGT